VLAGVDRYAFYTNTPLGGFVKQTFDDVWDDPKSAPLT